MLVKLLDPELMPVYEKLYDLLVGSIVLMGLFLLAFMLLVYLPRTQRLKRLEAENSRLQANLSIVSNHASVMTIRAYKAPKKANQRAKFWASKAEEYKKKLEVA